MIFGGYADTAIEHFYGIRPDQSNLISDVQAMTNHLEIAVCVHFVGEDASEICPTEALSDHVPCILERF